MHSVEATDQIRELDLWLFAGIPEYADAMYALDFFDLVDGRVSHRSAMGTREVRFLARTEIGTAVWQYDAETDEWKCETRYGT